MCKMFRLFVIFLFALSARGDVLPVQRNRGATLRPISTCCDMPELGDLKPLNECSNPKLPGPCQDVQCVFEKSGFLINQQTLNRDAYKTHLRKWLEGHKEWTDAIEKAIKDCVDKDIRQYLEEPCKAYDVFACTGLALLKLFDNLKGPHAKQSAQSAQLSNEKRIIKIGSPSRKW